MKSTLKIIAFLCLLTLALQASFQCNVANCQYCSYPNMCGQCQNNNVLLLNNATGAFYCQAVTCPANCMTCYQNNTCQTCNSGFFITSSGGCSQQQTSSSTIPPNCLWGSGSSNCTVCNYGFSLQAGYCYPIISMTANDANCMVKLTSTICQICANNYVVSPIGNCIQNNLN